MPASNNFRAVVRTIGIGLPMLVLLTSCNRDPLAPDCFVVENGECLIPYPGASDVTVACETVPEGAIGAEYYLDLNTITTGGTGVYGNWSASNLPPGLTLDPDTGILSGVPEVINATPFEVSVTDAVGGEQFEFSCGELVINDRLSALGVVTEEFHCIPHTASKDEMLAIITGGDSSDITCSPLAASDGSCPLGDGNGRPPPGVTFDADTCTHSGDLTGDRRGSWVWMVEVEQSGYTTRIPFCAQNDVDTFHDIVVTANAQLQSDLQPGLLSYDPTQALGFGGGSYVWDIQDPVCFGGDPAPCNAFGFKFAVTCSPFDPPFVLNGQSTDNGLTHELDAMGPVPDEKFRYRPWVASFEMSYCTSDTPADCDVDGAFEQNAQTRYHFDVVAFPEP